MPGRGFCPALVTVENPTVQKLALRSGVLAATRTVDVQFKYQANRHVENVTRADIKRRRRARVKTAADRKYLPSETVAAYAGISLLNSLLAGNLPLAK
jgi:hypothetical protein